MTSVIAYSFTRGTLRDGRPIPKVGETLEHEGPVDIYLGGCGLHASQHPFDALTLAPGPFLHLVKCEDIEQQKADRLVCRRQTILASVDATYLLRRFAADQALSVAHLWDMPETVERYMFTLDENEQATVKDIARDAEGYFIRRRKRGLRHVTSPIDWFIAWQAVKAAGWAASSEVTSAAEGAAHCTPWTSAARRDFAHRVDAALSKAQQETLP